MSGSKNFKRIKIAGLLVTIPIFLAAGPLAGYMGGEWIAAAIGVSPHYIALFCVIIGFAASVREVVRAIRIAVRTAREMDRTDD